MSLVNSGIGTKACVWDFHADGGLGGGNLVYSGISFKPGDVILDVRYQVFSAIAAPAVANFQLLWGTGAVLLEITPASLAGGILGMWGRKDAGVITTYDFGDTGTLDAKAHFIFGTPLNLNVNFTSFAPYTAGRVGFLITYAFTRF